MLDQQQRLDHGHKLNNAKMKMILRRHKWVVGQWKTSGFFWLDVVSFLGPEFSNFVFLPTQQTREGILIVAWRHGTFEVSHHRVH
jgi:hypothetical protein